MNTFTYTENGATQLRTTGKACLDLFAEVGSARNMALSSPDVLQAMFLEAWKSDPTTAFCIALWARAVRLGAGERAASRVLLKAAHQLAPQALRAHLDLFAELGSYKDYVRVADEFPELRDDVVAIFADGVMNDNHLASKWLPRRSKLYADVRARTGLTNREFRQRVARASTTVEQLLCARRMEDVQYDKLPSQAFNRYKRLFAREDGERLKQVITQKKLNAGALYPHEVFAAWFKGQCCSMSEDMLSTIIDAPWRSLPNMMPEGASFLPVLDTSGSMTWGRSVIPRDVAYPLALYCAERLSGPFRNRIVTFSSRAQFIELPENATTLQRMKHLDSYDIVENTNIVSVFELLLARAKSAKCPAEAMPRCVLLLSDMQFDSGAYCDITLMDELRLRYKYAGYEFPAIVYWNLDATNTGVAASALDNCALVSGFSPRLLKAVFDGNVSDFREAKPVKLDPLVVMENALAPIREMVDSTVLPRIPNILATADFDPTRGATTRQ